MAPHENERSFAHGAPGWIVLGCVFVACAIRLGWVLAIEVDPRAQFHFDMTWYDLAALTFLEGRILVSPDGVATAFWPPGYPALLATVYALFGATIRTAQVLNVALGGLVCWLTYRLSLRVCPRAPWCALGAAAIVAVFPGYVFFAPLTLSENVFIALFAGLVLLFARLQGAESERPFRHWVGFGALLGLAILTRGAASLFFVVPVTLWWVESRSVRTVAVRTAALALGAAAIVLPWTVRNTVTLGAPVIVSTSIGMALTYAHSPVADGSESLRMVAYRKDLLKEFQALANPEREVREMQRSVEAALRYALTHPLHELTLIPRRLFFLFQHDHAGMDWAASDGTGSTADKPLISAPIDGALKSMASGFFFVVCGLAAIGAWTRRADPDVRLLVATIAYFLVLHGVLFVGNPRYHAPLYPVLAILAAIGGATLVGRFRGSNDTLRARAEIQSR